MALSDNGLFKRAKKAVEEYKTLTDEEQRKLAMAEAAMNFENAEYEDKNGEKVTIPVGFSVSNIEGENTVKNGLVIIDSKGNEFVWVKVPKNITENAKNVTEIKDSLVEYTKKYRYENYNDIWYDGNGLPENSSQNLNDSSGCGLTCEQYTQLYEKMLNSIKKNNGFWVGRYEMGINNSIKANEEVNGMKIVQAQDLSNRMFSGDLTSSLMFGIQYDLVMKFFEENIESFSFEKLNTNDGLKLGNYRNNLWSISNLKAQYFFNGKYNFAPYTKENFDFIRTTTGASEKWKQMNIFDLFGNVWEYTLESYNVGKTNYPSVVRGGSFYEDSNSPQMRDLVQLNVVGNATARVVMY